MSDNAEACACYNLGLVHQTNKVSGFEYLSSKPFKSSHNTLRFGSQDPRFMLRTQLGEGYVRDDCVTIDCRLVVLEIQVPPCDIPEHIAELFDQKVGADVTFNVRGEIVEAHKVILAARSPVFKALFFGLMSEKREGHVTIQDMEPDVFKALLRFVYAGSVHGMGDDLDGDDYKDMIWHLLAAADRYAVDRYIGKGK
nr:unnamed protein product [Digitaria exilis]